MDANNTKYHLLLGERDWLPPLLQQMSSAIWWDQRRQGICLAPVINRLQDFTRESVQHDDRRRGAAFDHYGNVYWINAEKDGISFRPQTTPHKMGEFWHTDNLQTYFENTGFESTGFENTGFENNVFRNNVHGDFATMSPATEAPAITLGGLTVTTAGFLVVGTLPSSSYPSGLLVFDLHAGGPPTWLHWPVTVDFWPVDISCAPDGSIFILDRDPETAHVQVWHIDRNFRVLSCNGEILEILVNHDFYSHEPHGDDHSRNNYFRAATAVTFAPTSAGHRPVAIEALADNAFIVLVSPTEESAIPSESRIMYYLDSELIDEIALNETVIGNLLAVSRICGQDFAFLPETSPCRHQVAGRLFISSSTAAQAYELALVADAQSLALTLRPKLLPMRSDTGKALIVSAAAPFYDFGDRWLPLVEQPRHEYVSEGIIDQFIFDGDDPDCDWHRIIMDACIPEGTAVKVETRAANTEHALADLPWQLEPTACLRAEGSELPGVANDAEHSDLHESWDLLLQNAQGRFIQLRLTLYGNKRVTPYIFALRLYYPRFSYLKRYLPAVYQQDKDSAAFLDRFLANVEGLFTQLEDKISHSEMLFDTRTTPPEFLDWLGNWLGAFVDPLWDNHRKRLFIDNAVLLFRWRGTPAGLKALIKLAIDPCPDQMIFASLAIGGASQSSLMDGQNVRIVEQFETRRLFLPPQTASLDRGLLQVSSARKWHPEMGATALHQYFQTFLEATYDNDVSQLNVAWSTDDKEFNYSNFSDIKFPPLSPHEPTAARDWRIFTRDHLDFTYAVVDSTDVERYRLFLRARYQQIERLNFGHGLLGNLQQTSFDNILLPVEFPRHAQPINDWMDFVALALPIARQAHRFSVLLPTSLGELPAAMENRRARVEQIVEREKPAHTEFDVKFFWLMFQVGSARLGIDSALGEGGRFTAMVLGGNFLGQSYLGESHPWSLAERSILGRDRLSSGHQWRFLQ